MEDRMSRVLEERQKKGTLRRLLHSNEDDDDTQQQHANRETIDFSSNDYLGIARDAKQQSLVADATGQLNRMSLGATGSRLLSGDSVAFHALEDYLARVHRRPAALVCNSGYDANLSVVSSLLCTCIIYDEYCHNSLHMGIRLWMSQQQQPSKVAVSFRHNSLDDLKEKLEQHVNIRTSDARIVVIIESVYSMDGDVAPIREMLDLCQQYNALLVVDEAHGLGICGRRRRDDALPGTGVLAMEEVEEHPALLCSIHTFGKAAGCHGAVVCGSMQLKKYLANYAYPFIYSTALPPHSLVTIQCAYETMTGRKGDRLRETVNGLADLFRRGLQEYLRMRCPSIYLLPSTTPIQALMVPGNQECTRFCEMLYKASDERIRLYPIKTPTVPAGQERIRIIIHAHNTPEQVQGLVELIQSTLQAMGLSACRQRPSSKL